jgi:pimeloyl-ACP methyl ester carboxylesterase
VTATAPTKYAGVVPGAWAAALTGTQTDAVSPEPPDDHPTEVQYIEKTYNDPLGPHGLFAVLFPLLPLPAQPVTWYRGGYMAGDGLDFQPWKDRAIAQSRFDRYEIYSPLTRHWAVALDLEQINFSFQDRPPKQFRPDARLMLVAGDMDNVQPNAIYNSTIEVARALRDTAHGKAEFWLDTGHSIHSERPHLFVKEILYFLDNPDSGNSPNGTVVSTPPKADYSLVDR